MLRNVCPSIESADVCVRRCLLAHGTTVASATALPFAAQNTVTLPRTALSVAFP